ncbi:MAG: hypothetical protein CHACPFDD_01499 [Phycisphaerae bacterium]|nr:hypothetical protein [Phycisphaerae bacterium]
MATIRLAPDFREFLRLLGSAKIRYLLVGGYAVAFHGHPRTTGDMDVWVAVDPENTARLVDVLRAFGFTDVSRELFLEPGRVIRMGNPPVRIKILTHVSGVDFDKCYARRQVELLDGIRVSLISLADLRRNKRAAGRPKDLADLSALSGRSTPRRRRRP